MAVDRVGFRVLPSGTGAANRARPRHRASLYDSAVPLASALSIDIGLVVTFIGIGVVVNVVVVYIFAQVFGERAENQERKETV